MLISREIKNWKVSNLILTSDHRCITFHLNSGYSQPNTFRIPSATDFDVFNRSLTQMIKETTLTIESVKDLNEACEALNHDLVESFKSACAPKTIKYGRSAPFFTSEVKAQRRITRKAFNKAKNKNPGLIAIRRAEQRAYDKLLRRKHRSTFQDFCSSVESHNDATKLMKSCAKDPCCSIGSMKLPSGNYTDSPEATLKYLLETHFPGCVSQAPSEAVAIIPAVIADPHIADQIVSKSRIEWAIKSFAPYKAAGEDLIFPALLQSGLDIIIDLLEIIFKASIRLLHIPLPWRGVTVVFIPKLGQLDYTVAKAFRPISLTSIMLKTLEKMVDRHLRDEGWHTLYAQDPPVSVCISIWQIVRDSLT